MTGSAKQSIATPGKKLDCFVASLLAKIKMEWTAPDGIDVPDWRC
jgi:hypothetical protein